MLMLAVVTNRIKLIPWLLSMLITSTWAEEPVQEGLYTDKQCIECHAERNPELIQQWQTSPHGPQSGLGCTHCHGDRHSVSATRARQDSRCSSCHEGVATHSYATSKHGVISRLEADREEWNSPLKRGNYRSPGCSYCHLHDGDHGDTMAMGRGPEVRQWVCAGCHSPRYVRELFANARRQLEIADLKLEEGNRLIDTISDPEMAVLSELRRSLNRHRKNILYGVGHQSPDYQWWHGQPALDGDLIRIRNLISELLYQKAAEEKQ